MTEKQEYQNPYTTCHLCPRKCGIDRTVRTAKRKATGFCGMTDTILVSRASLHMWEEPCISGTNGSGTVFFAGCTLGCVYCQNGRISRGKKIPEAEIHSLKTSKIHNTASTDTVLQETYTSLYHDDRKASLKSFSDANRDLNINPGQNCFRTAISNEIAEPEFFGGPDENGNYLLLPPGKHFLELSPIMLAEVFLGLQNAGAHNINLVTPDHFMPGIDNAIILAKEKGLHLPIVCNVSGYESRESLEKYYRHVDVFLTDFKYMDSELAKDLSAAPDYPEVAKEAIKTMLELTGDPEFSVPNSITAGSELSRAILPDSTASASENNPPLLTRGIIVRHLVLPGHKKNTKAVLDYLHREYGDRIILSIMNQYTPPSAFTDCFDKDRSENTSVPGILKKHPELARKLTAREYENILDYAFSLGIENAFIQEGETADESFIPEF